MIACTMVSDSPQLQDTEPATFWLAAVRLGVGEAGVVVRGLVDVDVRVRGQRAGLLDVQRGLAGAGRA